MSRRASLLLSAALLLLLGWAGAQGPAAPDGLPGLTAVAGTADATRHRQVVASADDRADDREEQITDETAATARSDLERFVVPPVQVAPWLQADAWDVAARVAVALPAVATAFQSRTVYLPPSHGPPAVLLST